MHRFWLLVLVVLWLNFSDATRKESDQAPPKVPDIVPPPDEPEPEWPEVPDQPASLPRIYHASDAFPTTPPAPARPNDPVPFSAPGCWLHSSVVINGNFYLFGGACAYSHQFFNDMWLLDLGSREWREQQASFIPPFPNHRQTRTTVSPRPSDIPAPEDTWVSPTEADVSPSFSPTTSPSAADASATSSGVASQPDIDPLQRAQTKEQDERPALLPVDTGLVKVVSENAETAVPTIKEKEELENSFRFNPGSDDPPASSSSSSSPSSSSSSSLSSQQPRSSDQSSSPQATSRRSSASDADSDGDSNAPSPSTSTSDTQPVMMQMNMERTQQQQQRRNDFDSLAYPPPAPTQLLPLQPSPGQPQEKVGSYGVGVPLSPMMVVTPNGLMMPVSYHPDPLSMSTSHFAPPPPPQQVSAAGLYQPQQQRPPTIPAARMFSQPLGPGGPSPSPESVAQTLESVALANAPMPKAEEVPMPQPANVERAAPIFLQLDQQLHARSKQRAAQKHRIHFRTSSSSSSTLSPTTPLSSPSPVSPPAAAAASPSPARPGNYDALLQVHDDSHLPLGVQHASSPSRSSSKQVPSAAASSAPNPYADLDPELEQHHSKDADDGDGRVMSYDPTSQPGTLENKIFTKLLQVATHARTEHEMQRMLSSAMGMEQANAGAGVGVGTGSAGASSGRSPSTASGSARGATGGASGASGASGSGTPPPAPLPITEGGPSPSQTQPQYPVPFVNDQLWRYNLAAGSWALIRARENPTAPGTYPHPEARWLHTACEMEKRMLIFGGVGADGIVYGDLWLWDPEMNTWSKAEPAGIPILPREGHSAVVIDLDQGDPQMYVFGGISYGYMPFNDLWSYSVATNKWTQIKDTTGPVPPARWMHGAVDVWDQATGQDVMYIFGGMSKEYTPFDDLYAFYPKTKEWRKPVIKTPPPFPRMLHSMATVGDSIFVFGGAANNILMDDLWIYDIVNTTWRELYPTSASPFARAGATLTVFKPPVSVNPEPAFRQPFTPATPPTVDPYATPPPEQSTSQLKRSLDRPRKEAADNRFIVLFGGVKNFLKPLDAQQDTKTPR